MHQIKDQYPMVYIEWHDSQSLSTRWIGVNDLDTDFEFFLLLTCYKVIIFVSDGRF